MDSGSATVVAVAKCHAVLHAAEQAGLSVVRERAALGAAEADDPESLAFVPLEQYLALWEALMRRLREPAFPVAAAASASVDERGLIGFIAMTSATVGESLIRGIRLQRRWATLGQWDHPTVVDERVILRWREMGPSTRLGVRAAAEYAVTSMLVGLRNISGTDVIPLAVGFVHAEPPDIAAHRRVFGIEPTFGAGITQLCFDRRLLDQPLPMANAHLSSYLEHQCQRMLADVPALLTTSIRAQAVLRDVMNGGVKPSAALVAFQLNMSHRTLLRRLADEGTTYRRVLDEVRSHLMREHHQHARFGTVQLASMLGFSSVSAFRRARQRWNRDRVPQHGRYAPSSGSSLASVENDTSTR